MLSPTWTGYSATAPLLMKPIVLIHGYSSESPTADPTSIANIYGDLPGRLRDSYDVVEIDLSRYVSLNDSVSIADIARALNRALLEQHPHLLESGFHVVIHSTGALVIRTWIRLFSPQPSPIGNLVYLAGANLGSGWASIGQGQVARWGRFVFERGSQRGVKVLQSLEIGSSPTIDLHLFFTQTGSRMLEDYKVQEFIIIGSQADPDWFTFPIRYAHEDGSDGVVRVAAANLNFNHLVIEPNEEASLLTWPLIQAAVQAAAAKAQFPEYYSLKAQSYAGKDRPFGAVRHSLSLRSFRRQNGNRLRLHPARSGQPDVKTRARYSGANDCCLSARRDRLRSRNRRHF